LCKSKGVRCVKNKRTKGTSGNINNGIDNVEGKIKILFQDDQLGSVEEYEEVHTWGFCNSAHGIHRAIHRPVWNHDIKMLALGCNTYGSPSAMVFEKCELRFDERLRWLLDCEFYARMQQFYGLPILLKNYVFITEWEGQATNTVATGAVRLRDTEIVNKIYADI
jgi:hypothetical protein